MKECQACGMPMMDKEDFAQGDENATLCAYCTNADGSAKTCQEVFESGSAYFRDALDSSQEMADRITRKHMRSLPYWQGEEHDCLKGEVATDEEFAQAMKKLAEAE